MAKSASRRRFDKRAIELAELRVSKPDVFAHVWEQLLRSWIGEVRNRAHAQRSGETDERHLRIFEVLSQAQCLAQASGALSQTAKSLKVLEHECAKAVAALTDPRLYMFNEDCTTRIRNLSAKDRTRG